MTKETYTLLNKLMAHILLEDYSSDNEQLLVMLAPLIAKYKKNNEKVKLI